MSNPTFHCDFCQTDKPIKVDGGTGYCDLVTGHRVCYECMGDWEREQMTRHGGWALYLTGDRGQCTAEVQNWPGTLRFPVYYLKTGRHNMAGTRTDVWFEGPDGHVWHGTQYGWTSQVCHCKRTKHKIKEKIEAPA